MISESINKDLKWATEHIRKKRAQSTLSKYERVGENKYKQLSRFLKWACDITFNKENGKQILQSPINLNKIPGQSANRNTRSCDRAEIKYHIAKVIIDNPDKNCFAYREAIYIKTHLETYAKLNYEKKYNVSTTNDKHIIKTSQKQVKNSKRLSLRGLPKNWRQKLAAECLNTKFGNEILIMILSGCRPSEFQNGIEVIRSTTKLDICIKGAKLSDINNSGQSWRTISIDINNPLIGNLKSGTYLAKASSIENSVSHYGMKVANRVKNKISAYTLRHAFASDLKASNLSRAAVSAALGHQSMVTQSMYGGRSKKPLVVTVSVNAATPVRPVTKKSNLIAKKTSGDSSVQSSSSINTIAHTSKSSFRI